MEIVFWRHGTHTDDGPLQNQLGGGPGEASDVKGQGVKDRWVWGRVGGGGSEVSLLLGLRAKVLLVLGAAHLSHLRVLWHVRQRVGADDVPAEARKTKKNQKHDRMWHS